MDFPEELVTQILSRLPIKSLLRFKCVSKSWRNLISAKDFTFLHFTNYKPSDFVVASVVGESPPWNLLIARVSPPARNCAEEEEAAAAPTIVNHPLLQNYETSSLRAVRVPEVFGPCNGIFCFFERYEERIMLCNPLIQDYKIIPESNLCRQAIAGVVCVFMVGFGFDSKTKSHKILQIVRNTCVQRQQLEIYSLGTNSWKKLDVDSVPINSFCVGPLFNISSKIGWLGIQREICLFDLCDETVDMIPISPKDEAKLDVFPLRESIGVVLLFRDPRACYEIWILNDFTCRQSRSWSKLWTIEHVNVYRPLGFCGNSHLIFEYSRDCYNVVLYDLVNHDVVDVGVSMTRVCAYKESLISISGDKEQIQVLDSTNRLVL